MENLVRGTGSTGVAATASGRRGAVALFAMEAQVEDSEATEGRASFDTLMVRVRRRRRQCHQHCHHLRSRSSPSSNSTTTSKVVLIIGVGVDLLHVHRGSSS